MSTGQGILRRFNEAGIVEFVRRIEVLRDGGIAAIDDDFVTDGKLTEPIVPEVKMERPAFKTKRDAGEYLSERTRAVRAAYGDDDRGLWTWLSAWHWDAVRPVLENGERKVLTTYYYVYGFLRSQNSLRHLVAVSCKAYEKNPNCHLLLDSTVSRLGKAFETTWANLALTRIYSVPELLDILYWDHARNRAKRGALDNSPRPGDLRNRLPARIRQIEVTHDLTNLTAEQLLNLLGDEFRQWAVAQPQPTVTRRSQPATQQSPAAPTPPSP